MITDIQEAEFYREHTYLNVLPKQVRDFFLYAACSIGKNGYPVYEYADNFRYAALTDPKALEDFQKRHDKSCCGSREEIIEDENGKLWIVGFNYGH